MAEVIGIISGIMGIIKFSAECLEVIGSIRDSEHGRTDQVQELEASLGEYVTLNEQLQKLKEKVEKTRKLSDVERSIIFTARDLETIVQGIRDLINKVSVRPNAQFKILEVGRSATNHLMFRNDIKDLYKRLETQNKKIREKLKLLLAGDRHDELLEALQKISQQYLDLEIQETLNFKAIRQQLAVLVDQKSSDLHNFRKQAGALYTATQELEREEQKGSGRVGLLQSLYFIEHRQRWDNIDEAAEHTLSWLYDPSKTTFSTWLESESQDIYYITGWAGSGKSTLMKHAFENLESRDRLREWAKPRTLLCASFFFWNQGFAKQKSIEGLLRSLLYQVLRQMPGLISSLSRTEPGYVRWETQALMDMFNRVLTESEPSIKLCFFIDGLDEFEGDEELVAKLITIVSKSPHVKVCVSSRPRPRFNELTSKSSTTTMQYLTKDGMRRYVREKLQIHPHFRTTDVDFRKILCDEIADRANGVWLWVHLVVRDLGLALKRKESQYKLQSILDHLPKDLNEYFERIIDGVDSIYKMEMARTLLLTVFEVQPLPLYAFHLLDQEIYNADYALKAAFSEISTKEAAKVSKEWEDKIHERGRDLLVVNHIQHPIFLDRPVDFLHRTVRDFLKDQYYQKLLVMSKTKTHPTFIPPISLCRIMLFFLKKQPAFKKQFGNPKHGFNRMIGLVDELLYYARESEKHEDCQESEHSPVCDILDEVDAVNMKILKGGDKGVSNHWTNMRDPPAKQGLDQYNEGGNNCWIALAIQAGLVKYVRSLLMKEEKESRKKGQQQKKEGRPLLDYALRPRRLMPSGLPYHSKREEPIIDREMVKLLLEFREDPNRKVYSHKGRTVWALFLICCYESVDMLNSGEFPNARVSKNEWLVVSRLLISKGAREDCFNSADEKQLGGLH